MLFFGFIILRKRATNAAMTQPLSIYFAGELFSLKHLSGNAMLADAIQRVSNGRFACVVPQDLEQREYTAISIRDQDLLHVVSCDVGLFNFDGPELDSGTVVEYMIAKMLDIPCVIIRTDFRSAGDFRGLPWNLMLAEYPRTKVVLLDAMADYQKALKKTQSPLEAAQYATDDLARSVVEAFNDVMAEKPVLTPELRASVYEWIRHLPGATFAQLLTEDSLKNILSSKVSRGLV